MPLNSNHVPIALSAVAVAACLVVGAGVPVKAQVIRQLTDLKPDTQSSVDLDDSGGLVFAASTADPLGTNPEHANQIFKWVLPETTPVQLTEFSLGVHEMVSVADDGIWLAFGTVDDPLGTNPDHSLELFRIQADGTGLEQLTDDASLGGGSSRCPRVAGSGTRVAFQGSIDPHGTNSQHREQLFVLEVSTGVVTQLTFGASGVEEAGCTHSISDDGDRIVFVSAADLTGGNADGFHELFAIDAAGTDLRQLTPSANSVPSFRPMISGDGQTVVYQTHLGDERFVNAIGWDGTGQITLTTGDDPTIRDDGEFVYYDEQDDSYVAQIFSIRATGGIPTQLTHADYVGNPLVSGGGTRIVFRSASGLMSMNRLGFEIQQLTDNEPSRWHSETDITSDGSRVVYTEWDITQLTKLFRFDVDDSDPFLVTDANPHHPSITGDGETIVFMSSVDLFNEQDQGGRDLFRIQADGTGLAQLVFPEDWAECEHQDVAANGSVVVFQSNGQFGGLNGDGGWEVFSVPLGGGTVTQVSDIDTTVRGHPSVSADGVWTAWHDQGFVVGWSRGRTDGTLEEVIFDDGIAIPHVSGDGRFITFDSDEDPLGTNADLNREIFLYDAQSAAFAQLTVTTEGESRIPRISESGEWVYFTSSSPFFGPEPGNLFRFHVSTGAIERAGGRWDVSNSVGRYHTSLAVDAAGGRVVAVSHGDPTGSNVDGSSEVWLIDFETPNVIRPSQEAPTTLEWDANPRAVRYDVIRGDVAALGSGPGATIDLGPVVCLEDESIDSHTLGFPDPELPASGQAFFFLYRGTQGITDGPGSYGQGSNGAERVPAVGDCP